MSSTTRCGESSASTLAMRSRLIPTSPAKFSSAASISVSNVCKREVKATPRSQTFSDPISRNAGSCESRSVIDILIARHAAVNGLAEQVGQGKLSVFAASRIAQVLGYEIAQTQSFIQLSYHDETAIRGDA